MSRSLSLQAIKDATRFVLFETDVPDFEIATHGGSMFVVKYKSVPYAITAKHNLHDFSWVQLIVTNTRSGMMTAGPSAIYYASEPTGAAEGSDILDIAVIEFADDVTPDFFKQTAYDLSPSSLAMSEPGDALIVYGALTEKSELVDRQIIPQFAELQFSDTGPAATDPVLRSAIAKWVGLDFRSIAGVSGAPVFNVTKDGVCGMTVRGTLRDDGTSIIYYIDMPDIFRLLDNIAAGVKADSYVKIVSSVAE